MPALSPAEHLRRRGHIARALKNYLKDHNLTVRQFNEDVLDIKPGSVLPYAWLAGKSVPGPDYVPILAKALGRPASFFVAKIPAGNGHTNRDPHTAEPAEAAREPVEPGNAEPPTDLPVSLSEPPAAAETAPRGRLKFPPARVRRRPEPLLAMRAIREPATPQHNVLSFTSHGNGHATVTLRYYAENTAAHRVFAALSELKVDEPASNEPTKDLTPET